MEMLTYTQETDEEITLKEMKLRLQLATSIGGGLEFAIPNGLQVEDANWPSC